MKTLNLNKKRARRAVLIAIAVLAAATVITASAVNALLRSFEDIQIESLNFETAYAGEEKSVKQLPFSVSAHCGRVQKGQDVKILAEKDGWLKIVFNDNGKLKTGYIKTDYVLGRQLEQIKLRSIQLGRSSMTARAGETIDLDVETIPATATETISWSSSDESVATVKGGKITMLQAGNAVITADAQECASNIEITVLEKDPKLSFSQSSYTMNLNDKLDLNKMLNGGSASPEWESSNAEIVTVENGTAKAKGAGAVIITASANGASASCRIYIKNANTHASKPLDMQNAYGNIYNYHPSVMYFENGFAGYKYWCAYTPYENNNDYWENPHIQVSNDLKKWGVPKGFKNPLEPIPATYERGKVYNSDTELVYNTDTGTLECWWRFYDKPNKRVVLRRKTTKDGVHWSSAEDMLTGELYKYDFLSPAIIYEDGIYKMWAINQNTGHSLDYRESRDGKNWGDIRHIEIKYDDKDLANWHLDVLHTAKGYEALISAYYPEENDRTHMDLYYTCSQDNKNYTTAEKLFSPSDSSKAFDNRGLYRSAFLYANGRYYMFYSALNKKSGPSGIGLICGRDIYSMG